MAQENKTCPVCKEKGHSKFYCKKKPIKPIKAKSTKVKTKPPKKKETRSQVVKKLDSVFSQYIRQKDSVDGMATCVTCGESKPWKEMQNGHFYSRGRYGTRWDETNCHVQDYRCNVALSGNYINYTRYMIDRYGRKAVDALEEKSRTPVKITTQELREQIEHYKNKMKEN